jgi:flagellar protein FliS
MEVGGEFADNLSSLYNYIIDKLTEIDTENGVDNIDEVVALFAPIKDAWAAISEEDKQTAYQASQTANV